MQKKLAWFVAGRYLLSKKSHSVVNLLSIVSVMAIAIPAAAMVILLSVSNGFGHFIENLNGTFDPNIRISARKGVYFSQNEDWIKKLDSIDNIKVYTKFIEGSSIIDLDGTTKVITLRGIEENYRDCLPIDTAIIDGKYNKYNLLLGSGVAYSLNYALGISGEVRLYYPAPTNNQFFGFKRSFNADGISVSGVFVLDTYTDSKYVLAPLEFTQNLFSLKDKISSIGICVEDLHKTGRTLKKIQSILPDNFVAKDALQQREMDYMISKQEKYAIYVMLVFIMLIASLTLIGATVMMMVEKREQIETMKTLGATTSLIKRIFHYQSLSLTFFGGTVGVLLGSIVTLIQQHWGFIKINSDIVLISSYPVLLQFSDLFMIFVAIMLIGFVISKFTTYSMISDK